MNDLTSAQERAAQAVLAQKSKSFRLASLLLPRAVRGSTAVLYAWCRRCDDALDDRDERGSESPLAVVARLRRELDSVYGGEEQREPILAAFQRVVVQHRIPRFYPEELIEGMHMDARDTRYASLSDLLLYCYRVAGTVGLMMCHVMGVSDARALRNAAHLGIAMQLTNICRDVAEDAALERVYLPRALLRQQGASAFEPANAAQELARSENRAAAARVMRMLLGEADRYYRSGDRGLFALGFRCALAVRTARLLYAAIGARIALAGFDPLRGRAVTPTSWKLALVLKALCAAALEAPARLWRRLRPISFAHVVRPEDVCSL